MADECAMNSREWLYFRFYPGPAEKMDLALVTVIAPAVEQAIAIPGIRRWFFLRNFDDRGIHIRLRFCGTLGAINTLQRDLETQFALAARRLRATLSPNQHRIIPVALTSDPFTDAGYELDLYEQECDKYGGSEGVEIAEKVFQASSELAIAIVSRLFRSSLSERIPLAVQLMMMAAVEAFNGKSQEQFWRDYLHYWSGNGSSHSVETQKKLTEAARGRAAALKDRCAEPWDPPVAQAREAYRTALRRALADARKEPSTPGPEKLCFHYVHLLNNRLGILPLEEAYLAAFVEAIGFQSAYRGF
jgi:thiopeptide-type bacteriocin biosynthesis protein